MATLRVSSGDGSSAAAVDAFLRAAAFVLPDPLPMPRCLYSPLDPRASDSQLYQRLRRFVASPLYERLRRFVASPLYQRLRRFVASPLYQRLRRFVASSLRRFVASLHLRFCGLCGVLLQLLGVSMSPWVPRCSAVVNNFSCLGVKVRGFCCVRGIKVWGSSGCLGPGFLSGGSVVFGVSMSVVFWWCFHC
jgi:hypothetical protein